MKQELKEFIEKNIELIDAENFAALFIKCYDEASEDTMLELQFALKQIGVDVDTATELALHVVLGDMINLFCLTAEESSMTLRDFIADYLHHHFGIGYTAIEEFMIEHAYDWKNKVKIIEPQSWGKAGFIMKV